MDTVKQTLENDSMTLIQWFSDNKMEASPDNFQAISLGKKTHNSNISFTLDGSKFKRDEEVKLLGVTIDFRLNFDTHIFIICRKASRQLNVLKRLGNKLGTNYVN